MAGPVTFSAEPPPSRAVNGLPLLFVEDDAIVNLSGVELLESAGYGVHAAARAIRPSNCWTATPTSRSS